MYSGGRHLLRDAAGIWRAKSVLCPACNRATIWLTVYEQLKQLFTRYAKAAGIHGRSVHSLRRSIAVHLLEAGR